MASYSGSLWILDDGVLSSVDPLSGYAYQIWIGSDPAPFKLMRTMVGTRRGLFLADADGGIVQVDVLGWSIAGRWSIASAGDPGSTLSALASLAYHTVSGGTEFLYAVKGIRVFRLQLGANGAVVAEQVGVPVWNSETLMAAVE
jgi:hypothetical protein